MVGPGLREPWLGGGDSQMMLYRPPWQAMRTIFTKMAVTGNLRSCGR